MLTPIASAAAAAVPVLAFVAAPPDRTVALGRYVQVDAPVNTGNSGGPIANACGDVLGIVHGDPFAHAVNFGLRADEVLPRLEQFRAGGAAASARVWHALRRQAQHLLDKQLGRNPGRATAIGVASVSGTPSVGGGIVSSEIQALLLDLRSQATNSPVEPHPASPPAACCTLERAVLRSRSL